MKHILYVLALLLAFCSPAQAQCNIENKAVKGNEFLVYNLYFNWQFVWVPAGTATMSTVETTYRGRQAFRTSLTTRTSDKVDNLFRMRDTLLVYATKQLAPLYYRKASHEGSRNYVDEIAYSYPNGKCGVSIRHQHTNGTVTKEQHVYEQCVYDMLNIFSRARNYDPKGWKKGHTIPVEITGFSELVKAKLVYQGKSTVKADDGKKYKCLELSYIEHEKGEDKEIVRFFVTDDERHIPVRLDLYLRFGIAKAFLKTKKV